MSWTNRLKKAVGGEASPARRDVSGAELELPPVEARDPSALSRDEIVGILRDDLVLISEEKLTVAEIEPDGHIFDYGYVDSLSAVIFLARIEERFGTQIEDVEILDGVSTLEAIADRIKLPG